MKYYPLSQIKTGFFTNGNEYILSSNGDDYVGPYYKTSNGKKFTGLNSNDPTTELLLLAPGVEDLDPFSGRSVIEQANDEDVPRTTNPSFWVIQDGGYRKSEVGNAGSSPIQVQPKPTENDYKLGEFQRYFLKKVNSHQFIEVTKSTYQLYAQKSNEVQYALFIPIAIPWELTGKREEVYKVNLKTVEYYKKQNNLVGVVSYFNGEFSKYYLFSSTENLFTDGTEFKNRRTQRPYRGRYHIHPSKGPMVGAEHVSTPHDFLDPITELSTIAEMTASYQQSTPPPIQTNTIQTSGGSGGGY